MCAELIITLLYVTHNLLNIDNFLINKKQTNVKKKIDIIIIYDKNTIINKVSG